MVLRQGHHTRQRPCALHCVGWILPARIAHDTITEHRIICSHTRSHLNNTKSLFDNLKAPATIAAGFRDAIYSMAILNAADGHIAYADPNPAKTTAVQCSAWCLTGRPTRLARPRTTSKATASTAQPIQLPGLWYGDRAHTDGAVGRISQTPCSQLAVTRSKLNSHIDAAFYLEIDVFYNFVP